MAIPAVDSAAKKNTCPRFIMLVVPPVTNSPSAVPWYNPARNPSAAITTTELTINVFREDGGYSVEFIGNAPKRKPWMHKHWHGETPVQAVENAIVGISAIAAGVGPKQNMYWVARHLMTGTKETN